MQWYGGKPAGWIFIRQNDCQVSFTRTAGIKPKSFQWVDYPSRAQATAAAEIWQKKTSDEHGLTKNMYRTVQFGDELYLEVLLQNDLIMMCDLKHIRLVEERIWTANKAKGKYTYYVKSRASKKRKQKYGMFHRLAFPQYKEIDHINRDGLDNRPRNIREGRGRVNANNKRIQKNNKSGVKGVFHEGGKKPRWRAQWNDVNGKKCSKSFGVGKWGEDVSFEMACNWRAQEMSRVNMKIYA
jgi:hypothetical protein